MLSLISHIAVIQWSGLVWSHALPWSLAANPWHWICPRELAERYIVYNKFLRANCRRPCIFHSTNSRRLFEIILAPRTLLLLLCQIQCQCHPFYSAVQKRANLLIRSINDRERAIPPGPITIRVVVVVEPNIRLCVYEISFRL